MYTSLRNLEPSRKAEPSMIQIGSPWIVVVDVAASISAISASAVVSRKST